jgi:hypothetical protein
MRDTRRGALLLLAGAHLAIVAASAAGARFPRGPIGGVIAGYAAYSGAEAAYGFFVPSVDAEIRPCFEVHDNSGRVTTAPLETPRNVEADLRVGNLLSLFWTDDDVFRSALVGSWVAAMFERHPAAKQVVVAIDFLDLPSMRAFREGHRPTWVSLGRAAFSPDGSSAP